MRLAIWLVVSAVLVVAPSPAPATAAPAPPAPAAARVVARAREEVARRVSYDGAYARLAYPGGDVDPTRGVCTDVVVRALRAVGLDLQRLVHEDVTRHPEAYRHVSAPDASIDHRRVPSLLAYFERHSAKLPNGTKSPADRASWRAGDVVVWQFGECPACRPRHVGVVSDRVGDAGLPLVVHNIGPAATEEDVLEAWTIIGHYRVVR